MLTERFVRWLYFDSGRQICTGRGLVVANFPHALSLNWLAPGGVPATEQQVMAAWAIVRGLRKKQELPTINDMRSQTNIRLQLPPVEAIVF